MGKYIETVSIIRQEWMKSPFLRKSTDPKILNKYIITETVSGIDLILCNIVQFQKYNSISGEVDSGGIRYEPIELDSLEELDIK